VGQFALRSVLVDLHIDLSAGPSRRDAIYRQIRSAILDGRLSPGEALPPTRELAQRLAVSRNTVGAAYDRLTAEGFLEARVGSGTFVRGGVRRESGAAATVAADALRPVPVWNEVPYPPRSFAENLEFDFRAGVPDLGLFPFETWRRLLSQQVRETRVETATYGEPQGFSGLRAEVARHLGVSRDVRATASDVVITNGAQQAVDLVARVLLRPGDLAAVEDPGYPPPRLLMRASGIRVARVPVDDEGIVVERIPAGCRLVYVTPSHQYPLGLSMSLARRMELLAWAERTDAAILEDDYDSEFRYTGRPLEPLHSLDDTGRVLYLGSFSKVLYPALRLGFLVVPRSVRSAVVKAKYLADWHSPGPLQAALAAFFAEGGFARHVRKMRREYAGRHDLMVATVAREFGDVLSLVPSSAGLHVSARAREDGFGARALARAARAEGIRVYPLGEFAEDDTVDGLVFGFGAIDRTRIPDGVRTLRRLWEGEGPDRRPR
jgi:GntR family transcriptional regulator/MocR family aminotransferase